MQTAHFARTRKVTAVDLPGHGGRPWNGESLDAMADALAAQADPAGTDVVASSFGGLVLLKLWAKYPQLVRRAVFIGAVPRFTATQGFPAGLVPERIRKLAGQFEGDVAKVLGMFFRSLFTMKERESPAFARTKDILKGMLLPQRQALLAMLEMLEREDLRPLLARFDTPALFLFGDSDPICPLMVTEPLRALCPSAKIESFKGTGHFPFLTIPEVVDRRIERFLA